MTKTRMRKTSRSYSREAKSTRCPADATLDRPVAKSDIWIKMSSLGFLLVLVLVLVVMKVVSCK